MFILKLTQTANDRSLVDLLSDRQYLIIIEDQNHCVIKQSS